MTTRRGFLKASSAVAVGSVAVAGATRSVAAAHYDAKPEYVTLDYDQSVLESYRPSLVTRDIEQVPSLYGMVARSTEYDSSVCVYACEYEFQDGVSPFPGTLSDSHLGDHEWFYVEIDEGTNEVVSATWTAYHWYAGRSQAPGLPMDGTHVKAHIVHPWHQYYLTSEIGGLFDVQDLTAVFQSWLDNGLEESLQPGTVVEPWTMLGPDGRTNWWRDNFAGFSTRATLWSAFYDLGLYGADSADPVI